MAPSRLPTDILPENFEQTKPRDLLSICLASRAFRYEGQRALFRNTGCLTIGNTNPRHTSFVDTITRSPHRLASFVRVYEQSWVWEAPSRKQNPRQILADRKAMLSVVAKTARALRHMVNLKTLRIWNNRGKLPKTSSTTLEEILVDCSFQLEAFTWAATGEDTLVISNFLPLQVHLKELELGCSFQGLFGTGVDNSICPELDSISGSVLTTHMLLTNGKRAIKCLRWTCSHSTYSKLPDVLTGLESIQLLDYECEHRTLKLIDIASFLVNVIVLRIHAQGTWSSLWMEDYIALGKIRKLQILIITMKSQMYYESAQRVAEDIFLNCPSLQYIDIRSWSRAERYTRSGPSATKIESCTLLPGAEEYSWHTRLQFLPST